MTLEQRFVPELVHVRRTLEGSTTATIDGKPITGVGHQYFSPQNRHRGHENRVRIDADRIAVVRNVQRRRLW
ncbi:hypothetical protein [Burkholderia sp. BCC0419]|uniref:hypothetical protein n=1 Tax=Burkholderia sp. BCC0419 TaxID=486878 RepID=UPI001FC83591|nr:hypothetical protein [Burkholderia sp. BCC0419]